LSFDTADDYNHFTWRGREVVALCMVLWEPFWQSIIRQSSLELRGDILFQGG
jgi:hypothetical protein